MFFNIPSLFNIPLNKAHAVLYNSCSHQMVIVKRSIVDNAASLNEIFSKTKMDHKFLKDINFNLSLMPSSVNIDIKIKPNNLFLILSSKCNLKCKYCYQRKISNTNQDMNEEVIKKAINGFKEILLQDKNISSPRIIFYGGEPLINKKGFLYAINMVNELKKQEVFNNLEVSLITNGTLIDLEIVQAIKKASGSISVSLDGPAQINSNRISESAFSNLHEKIKLIKLNRVPLAISCTVFPAKNDDLLSRVKWIVNHVNPQKIGINMFQYSKSEKFNEKLHKKMVDEIISVYEYTLKIGLPEGYLSKIIEAFTEKQTIQKWCASYGQQIVVSPSGDIKKCLRYCRSKSDSINISVLNKSWPIEFMKSKIIKDWMPFFPLKLSSCYDCIAIGICGGGHRCSREVLNQNVRQNELKDLSHCMYIKTVSKWLVLKSATYALKQSNKK